MSEQDLSQPWCVIVPDVMWCAIFDNIYWKIVNLSDGSGYRVGRESSWPIGAVMRGSLDEAKATAERLGTRRLSDG